MSKINYTKSIRSDGKWEVTAMEGNLYKGFAVVETEAMADMIINDADNPEIKWEY